MSEKKVILITGATKGIGFATAKYLAGKGYVVYGSARNQSSIPSDSSGIHYENFDVCDLSSIQRALKQIIKKEGQIDVLINNAGYALVGPLECLKMEEITQQMDVNFYGVIRMCQEVLPYFRQQRKGHIINISSEQGVYGAPFGSIYSATKAAVESLSEALKIELLNWDIPVSIIEPGGVSTQFFAHFGTREITDTSYQKIFDRCKEMQQKKNQEPESLGPTQEPELIAELIYQVIKEKNPKLRYQTSDHVKKMVGVKLKDLTGEAYVEALKPLHDFLSV